MCMRMWPYQYLLMSIQTARSFFRPILTRASSLLWPPAKGGHRLLMMSGTGGSNTVEGIRGASAAVAQDEGEETGNNQNGHDRIDGGNMPSLPSNVVKYAQVPRKSPAFTKDTIPKALLRSHNTRRGTWGVINVVSGCLRYQINEPMRSVHVLAAGGKGIIEPRMKHEVAPLTDDVAFFVEFMRLEED